MSEQNEEQCKKEQCNEEQCKVEQHMLQNDHQLEEQIDEQMRIITKGTELIVGEEDLREKIKNSLIQNRPLHIKFGLDPSSPEIHIGHAVPLRKMKQMQDLGHRVIIIIGDFTGMIGDPSGKSKGRKALTKEQVRENALTYQTQIFKVLDINKTEVRFNSEWLSKLNFEQVIQLAMTTTVARILERDDFQNRYKNNTPIGLHEFFYPLMQAYDSIEIEADIELGGTDQTFNILMGRTLQKAMDKEQQAAIFVPILEGLDGIEKMSKSLGNYIGVDEPAQVMFKKVMEVPDNLIVRYFTLATDEHPDRIEQIKGELENGRNPRDIKLELAYIITSLYHSQEETKAAQIFYEEAFGKKSIPLDIPELALLPEQNKLIDILSVLVQCGCATSNAELRRLIAQGGMQLNGEKVINLECLLQSGDVLKIGKKRFLKVIR